MAETKTEEVEVEAEECERVVKGLKERLNDLDDNRQRVQETLHEICDKLQREADEMEVRIELELEAAHKKGGCTPPEGISRGLHPSREKGGL